MAYWLIKSEPDEWSWDQQVGRGAKGEAWSGIRNHQARNNLQAMKKGDRCLFYHTGGEKRVVGIADVAREAYPDPTTDDARWVCVDVKAVEPLPAPVTLEQIRAAPALKDMVLVKNSRLSVQPVTAAEWALVRKMGGLKS
jgi:predicted RNA-binding protein with PUA-like domain